MKDVQQCVTQVYRHARKSNLIQQFSRWIVSKQQLLCLRQTYTELMNIRLNGEKAMQKDMGETEFYLPHRKMDVKIPWSSLLLCIKILTNFYKINEHQTHARG